MYISRLFRLTKRIANLKNHVPDEFKMIDLIARAIHCLIDSRDLSWNLFVSSNKHNSDSILPHNKHSARLAFRP